MVLVVPVEAEVALEEVTITTLLEGEREGVADGETAGVEAGVLEATAVYARTMV